MITPTPASVSKARELLTAWSEEEGCSVVSRYEGDRWDKLVGIIATAIDQQIERDVHELSLWQNRARAAEFELDRIAAALQDSKAIRQQGAR